MRDDQDVDTVTTEVAVPSWVLGLCQAARRALKTEDVEQIVRNQVELAKKGNQAAIKFVFGQLLGGDLTKGATFIQNNYGGGNGRDPKRPTRALPGSPEKVEEMRRRVAAGEPPTRPDDARSTED